MPITSPTSAIGKTPGPATETHTSTWERQPPCAFRPTTPSEIHAKGSMKAENAAITHGLDGTLVEPDWPPLSLPEVHALLRHYPSLGNATKFLSVSPRPLSAASVVGTAREPVFIKRHHSTVR